LYFLALNWSYLEVDSVLYSGLGFLYANSPWKVFLTAFAMAVIPSLWLPFELRYPSQVCYWLIYLCVVVPTMFLPYHVLTYQAMSELLPLPVSVLLSFLILGLSYRFPTIRLSKPHINQRAVVGLVTLAAVGLIAAVIGTSGFQFSLSLDDAYERRFDAREAVVGGSLRAYAISTLSHSLGPLLVAIGYVRRNIVAFLVGVTGSVCIFSLAGTKTDMVAPVFLFALLILATRYRKVFGVAIAVAASVVVIAAVAQFLAFGRGDISTYFVRRQIFIPGLLTCFYWDFFSNSHYIYFSDSILRWFVPRQYNLPMARLIGEVYFGNPESNANANVWASAFANAGYAGMFCFTVLLGLLFRLIDGIAQRGDFFVASLMCGMFGLTWTNGGLQTSMLSNGIVVSLVVMYLLQPTNRTILEPIQNCAIRSRSRPLTSIARA
jgi:oligosaccharide repeat unit polymerase